MRRECAAELLSNGECDTRCRTSHAQKSSCQDVGGIVDPEVRSGKADHACPEKHGNGTHGEKVIEKSSHDKGRRSVPRGEAEGIHGRHPVGDTAYGMTGAVPSNAVFEEFVQGQF